MKKLLLPLLLLTLTLAILTSCAEKLPDGAVKVYSSYPNLSYLTPGDFDYSKSEDGTWARYGYNTYVTEVNGALAVMPSHLHGSSRISHVEKVESFALRGENEAVGNILGNSDGVFLGGELALDGACVGILPSYYNERALVFTVSNGSTKIHLFERKDTQSSWTLTDVSLTFDGEMELFYCYWPSQFYDAPKVLYVVTDKNLTVLESDGDLTAYSDGELSLAVKTIDVPEWWSYLKPTSITRTEDGTIFVGEREGVVGIQYSTDACEITYYPINYPVAMREN